MNAMFFLPVVVSLGVVFVLPMASKEFRARLAHEPVEAIMFGVAAVLTFAFLFFAAVATRTHNFEILRIPVLATGAFAVAGIVFGFVRSLRNSRKPIA